MKPCKPIPYNLWAKTSAVEIDAELLARRAKKPPLPSPLEHGEKKKISPRGEALRLRGIVTRDLFAGLPLDVRTEWRDKANLIHEEALAEWSTIVSGKPSTTPTD